MNVRTQKAMEAASKGDFVELKQILEEDPDHCQEIIEHHGYNLYLSAGENGHLHILQYLEEISPHRIRQMIEGQPPSVYTSYIVYSKAAENGHLDILKHLEKIAPDLVQQMIEHGKMNGQYRSYRCAARKGQLHILKHLEEMAPDRILEMITTAKWENDLPYRLAVSGKHFHILKHLEEMAPDHGQLMMKKTFRDVYPFAVARGDVERQKLLLSIPECFAVAEMHEEEYGEISIHPFVAETLAKLRAERQVWEASNPHAVFDVSNPEAAKLFFYMIRNIIRRNNQELNDDLRFLLDIPSVKALVHSAVTPNQENELLRLAMWTGNTDAVALLINIPAVRQLAERDNYYRDEALGELDLQAFAQDQESSMKALTLGERKRLDAVIKKYEPLINEYGVNEIISEIRQMLIERYIKHPPMIFVSGNQLPLPARWDEFQKLNLQGEVREEALKAYYQHKDHTALRYLSKPNYWMNEHAHYINEDPVTDERWSTFEEYQPIISLLYLAATDKSALAINGHTYEGRVDHFIDELAQIGRAHNWDKSRIKVNAEGEPIVNESGEVVEEEYDDLTADRPSCFSGVKRRLFQSVVGHPLLTMLTQDMIQQELKSFAHAHFKSAVNDMNREDLKSAIDILANEIDIDYENVVSTLKEVDIRQEEIDEFIKGLRIKYGDQFDNDAGFMIYIINTLSLSDGLIPESMNSHFSKLYDYANLKVLLENPAQSEKFSTSGIFVSPPQSNQESSSQKRPAEDELKEQSDSKKPRNR